MIMAGGPSLPASHVPSGDATKTVTLLREAVAHMSMIADVLAEATVKQFPDKF